MKDLRLLLTMILAILRVLLLGIYLGLFSIVKGKSRAYQVNSAFMNYNHKIENLEFIFILSNNYFFFLNCPSEQPVVKIFKKAREVSGRFQLSSNLGSDKM